MNLKQKHLVRAAEELGLKIILDYEISLPYGTLLSEALLPELGGSKGMLVFSHLEFNRLKEITREGYGATSWRKPNADERYDVKSYIRMFSDWGWCGEASRKPLWISPTHS